MKTPRSFLVGLAAGVVGLALIPGVSLAGEILGHLTKVDADGKKLTITETGSGKSTVVTVNDKTVFTGKKGETSADLSKLSKQLAKADDSGKTKKFDVKITEEKGVAVKVQLGGEPKKAKTDAKPKKKKKADK